MRGDCYSQRFIQAMSSEPVRRAAVPQKAKRWVFTSYDVYSVPNLNPDVAEYCVYGREVCPTTSRRHLQGFVAFKNRQSLQQVKKQLPGAHLERTRGTPEECADYCRKDGDFVEFGCIPTTTGRPTQFGDVLRKAANGEITSIKEEHPGIYLRYKATLLSEISFTTTELSNSCGVWLVGPPRSGKDYAVRQLKSVYSKNLNKWWDGYRNEDNVLISDVEPDHGKWLGYFLKIWSDRYAFNAEIKGGTMLIRPKKIFVTSNFTIDDVFTNAEIQRALLARFTVYDYTGCEPKITKRMCVAPSRQFVTLLQQNEEGCSFSEETSASSVASPCTDPPIETETSPSCEKSQE